MSPEIILIIMIGSLLALLALGLPLAFLTGGIGSLVLLFLFGPSFFVSVITSMLGTSSNILYAAVPVFIFMGTILEGSAIAEDLYAALHAWLGGVRGGLAMGTVVICCIFAAMVGVAGASIVIIGLIALPNMLKYKYDKNIAMGTILAGGTLGQLIPPSLLFIAYGVEAGVPIGDLFKGGVPAGLLLGALFLIYIFIRATINKELCPVVPPEDRPSLKEKVALLKNLVLPGLLILFVLGSIFTGIATPSEAASVGVIGALISTAVNRRLNLALLKKSVISTVGISGMILWLIFGAKCYSLALIASGGMHLMQGLFIEISNSMSLYPTIITMLVAVFVMGFFLDPVTIIVITVPIFTPIIKAFNIDPIWFGVVYVVALQLSYITPPFGYSLFYLKGVTPPEISLGDIFASVWWFVLLNLIGLLLMLVLPVLLTGLI
ncbi:MAG: TRAP transporter large permease subunit [Proteobacteria bacterium]|nr:TRAP transporter large permease subunit [Pseudomonadota bacterium]MBU2468502.1 TRAP transporter large permease subunit [Pseudomonadota bacterium]